MLFKKKSNEFSDWLQNNAPSILFWVAAVILILFDLRVLDVTYKLTASVLLTVGAIFATGLMFFIWKVGFGYTLANKTQVTLSSIGMAISLLASAVFGGMDYFVTGGLVIDAGTDKFSAIDLLFWGVPILSVIHVIMLLVFWYMDPVVTAARRKKQADDDYAFTKAEMEHAKELLQKRTGIINDFVATAQIYGKDVALQQLDSLGIDRSPFEGIDVDGHGSGHGKPAMTSPPASMTPPAPAMAISPVPVQVMAGSNGNGSKANPTPAGTVS